MNTTILSYINTLFTDAGINYSYMVKSGEVVYPYFVGSYLESPEETESGEMAITFSLDGWTKNSWLELEEAKELLAEEFRNHSAIVDGYGVAIIYSDSTPVAQDDAELKRIQINFDIRIWRHK